LKNKVIRAMISSLIVLEGFVSLVYGKVEGGTESCSLPWALIAEKFSGGGQFCTRAESGNDGKQQGTKDVDKSLNSGLNYVFQQGSYIAIKLPAGKSTYSSLQEIVVSLDKWAAGSWQNVDKIGASIKSDEIKLSSKIASEGFFRLRFPLEAPDEQVSFETYAIVSDNWKKDILAFCRELKQEIELKADPKLIFSSIAASHFDYTMEIISRTSFLSDKILRALHSAVYNKKVFDAGQCPDFVVGELAVNKLILRRFPGGPVVEFVLSVPLDYDSSRKWPLLLHVDPRNRWTGQYGNQPGMVNLVWHTISHQELHWKEYEVVFELIKKKLNLDEDRVYIDAACGDSLAGMALALKYPDQWAECGLLFGNSYRQLVGNALNLPMIYVRGVGHDSPQNLGYYYFLVKCAQYYGCRHFKHSYDQGVWETRGERSPDAVREKNPRRVLYTIESHENPRAYWVKIDGRVDENLNGTIDASVDGQTIYVRTENVDAYSLDLVQAPVDSNKPVEIIENGQSLGYVIDQAFTKKSDKYTNAIYVKNKNLHGPVWDVFTEPYMVVYGTGSGDREISKVNQAIARLLAGTGPCFADTNMPEELIDSHNLILVGMKGSNLWLSKICKEIPVQIKEGQIIADGKIYKGDDTGFFLIYPDPLNPDMYMAVFSANSSKAMSNITKAFTEAKSITPADVGIYEMAENGDIKWHILEKFNTVWDWHYEYDDVLAVVKKEHTKYRWSQLVAKALREHLEADVAICEDHFRLKGSVPVGQLTYRDVFNSFRNDWIVKIKVDGEILSKLLMVPFNDITDKEASDLFIDGVSFVKMEESSAAGTTLGINELVKDKKYTIALPYKLVNGQRTGIVLKDYEIVGEGYLVPLLKDYLCKNKSLDLDGQLDSIKLKMF